MASVVNTIWLPQRNPHTLDGDGKIDQMTTAFKYIGRGVFKQEQTLIQFHLVSFIFWVGGVEYSYMKNSDLQVLNDSRLLKLIKTELLQVADTYSGDCKVMFKYFESRGNDYPSISDVLDYGLNIVPENTEYSFSTVSKHLSMIVRSLKEIQTIVAREISSSANQYPSGLYGYLCAVVEEAIVQIRSKKNALRQVHLPRVLNTQVRALDHDEIEQMVQAADPQMGLIISLLYHTGARINALLDLRWNDIELLKDGNAIFHLTGKRQKSSVIVLGKYISELMIRFPQMDKKAFVFYNTSTGKKLLPSYFTSNLNKLLTQFGSEYAWVSAHTFRKSLALYLYEMGISYNEISKYLTHSDISITRHYLNPELDTENLVENLPTLTL
jgi:integrase